MSYIKYSKKQIDSMIQENKSNGMGKVPMVGVYNDLKTLKPVLEKLYDDHILYLSFWRSECAYHGWDANSDVAESMALVTDGITDCIKKAYALVLTGLGEETEDKND